MSKRRKALIYGIGLPFSLLTVYALYDSMNRVVLGTPEEIDAAIPQSLRVQALDGNPDAGRTFFLLAHISNEAQINRGVVSPSLVRCLRLIELGKLYADDPRPPGLTPTAASRTPLFGAGQPTPMVRLSHPGSFHEAIAREYRDVAEQLLKQGDHRNAAEAFITGVRFLLKPVPAVYSRYGEDGARTSSSGLPPLQTLCLGIQEVLSKHSIEPAQLKSMIEGLPSRGRLRDHYAGYLKLKLDDLKHALVDLDASEQRDFQNGRLNVPQMLAFVSDLMVLKIADLDKPSARRSERFRKWQSNDFNAFVDRYQGRMMDGWEGFTFRYEPNGRGRAVLSKSDTLDLTTDFHSVVAQVELTKAWLACKLFKAKFKRFPSTLQEVVDVSILDAIPADPFDGKQLRYDPKRSALWFVGHDCVDGNGVDDLVAKPLR